MITPTTMSTPPSLLSDKTYNILKLGAQLVLPAIGALYFALAAVWDLPAGAQVTGTIAALNVFVGVVVTFAKMLHEASWAQYDGSLALEDTEDGTTIRLQQVDPEALLKKDSILFKVNRPAAS